MTESPDPDIEHTLFHAGDLGDIIYALPIIKAIQGGGHIRLGPRTGMTRELMTPERYALLAPLLDVQPYIRSHAYAAEPERGWADGNRWRMTYKGIGQTLAAAQAVAFNLHPSITFDRWLLNVEPKEVAPVVFAKSRRYANKDFPWDDVVGEYGIDAVFVGTEEEYALFSKNWLEGYVGQYRPRWCPTKNFLELAQVIAGCRLFVGNQSAPYAVAEGLKVRTIQETSRRAPDCIFPRANATYCIGKDLELPDV